MGIKNFNPFLEKHCPQAFINLSYNSFKGKKIAVDSDNVFFKIKCRAYSAIVNSTDVCIHDPDSTEIFRLFLQYLHEEIEKYCKYGITLVFVFDGKYIDEKSETQNKRKIAKEKTVNTANKCKEEIRNADLLERTSDMLKDLRKKMQNLGSGLSKSEKHFVISLLKSLGFPVLQATEEGEKLCAMLCIEGYVDAVYTRDTDVVAMGCPLTITEEAGWIYNKTTKNSEISLKCTIFKPILSSLNMEYNSFLDLCIMSGCDFNSNIPKLAIGKSYKLLEVYKTIDKLPEKYDTDILNYKKCREIFAYQKSEDICTHDISVNICQNTENQEVLDNIRDNMREISEDININFKELLNDWKDLRTYINYCESCCKNTNTRIEKFPSLNKSRLSIKIINNTNTQTNTQEQNSNSVNKEQNDEKMKEYIQQTPSPVRMSKDTIKEMNRQQIARYLEKQKH